MPFFSLDFSRKKSLLSCPYFAKKNIHSLKSTLLSRPYFSKIGTSTILKNKLVSCHFFPLSQIITALIPIFYKRNVHSQKYRIWFLYYFPIFHEKTTSLMPYFVGKTSTCKKQPALMHFFSQFSRKNYCSHAHIL